MEYIAKTGLNYTPKGAESEKRVEAGEECSDVPADDIAWLLECGHIEASTQPGQVTMSASLAVSEAPDGD